MKLPKPLLSCLLILTASAAATAPNSVRAQEAEGHSGGNGGDPVPVTEAHVRDLIGGVLRFEARDLVAAISLPSIQDPAVRTAFEDMLKRGLLGDLIQSRYLIQPKCVDQDGVERAATSLPNDLKGDICFDAKKLADQGASDAQIIALAVHESAHHFGYEDKDGAINAEVLSRMVIALPARPETKTTAVGIVFTRVTDRPELGRDVWRDPSGMIWGELHGLRRGTLPAMTFADATQACSDLGGRIPSMEDYTRLYSYVASDSRFVVEGMRGIFGNALTNSSVWTSTHDQVLAKTLHESFGSESTLEVSTDKKCGDTYSPCAPFRCVIYRSDRE